MCVETTICDQTTVTPLQRSQTTQDAVTVFGRTGRLQILTLTLVAVNSAKLLLYSSLGAVPAYLTSVNGCSDIDRLDLTYCMRYGDVIGSPHFHCLRLSPAYATGSFISVSILCSPPLFTLMTTESLIVEVVQFGCTKECVADPSLFEAVRNIVQRWQ